MLKRVGLREDPWGTLQMILVAGDCKGGDENFLGSFDEEGGEPVQCLVSDSCVEEACSEDLVADSVEGCGEVQEDECNGLALVNSGSDVVSAGDEGGLSAVVLTESRLGGVK
ncbi:hypothetical protein NDU88_001563 [Pleurodeles waltl]|uniref:Uncharacterized protein n=1 Tax=Pleurodeles waltl TaxID=8319 RepID=A0AAV7W1W4_PLEWA|nr:hypothetical protein NDU88_001563 [Pleurodeles waltl]